MTTGMGARDTGRFHTAATLLEVVPIMRAREGFERLADEVRAERKRLELDPREAARAIYITAPALVQVELKRAGFATAAGYGLVLERLRSAAAHRARKKAGA